MKKFITNLFSIALFAGFSSLFGQSGSIAWTERWNTDQDFTGAIATFSNGSGLDSTMRIYTAGYVDEAVVGNANDPQPAFFIICYDGFGNKIWYTYLDELTYGIQRVIDMEVYIDGNGSPNPIVLTQSLGDTTGFDAKVLKFNRDGALMWTCTFDGPAGPSTSDDQPNSLFISGTQGGDYVWFSGISDNRLQPGTEPLLAFIAKADINGAGPVITPVFGTTVDLGIMVGYTPKASCIGERFGNSFLATTWSDTLDAMDAMIKKFDANGANIWTRMYGTSNGRDDVLEDMAWSGLDSSVVAVGYDGAGGLDNQALILKVKSDNSTFWSSLYDSPDFGGSDANDAAYQVVVDPVNQNIYFGGEQNGGPNGITTMVGKVLTGGAVDWVSTYPNSQFNENEYFHSLELNQDQSLTLCAQTYDSNTQTYPGIVQRISPGSGVLYTVVLDSMDNGVDSRIVSGNLELNQVYVAGTRLRDLTLEDIITVKITFTVDVEKPQGQLSALEAWPVPSTSVVAFTTGNSEAWTATLTDLTGRMLYQTHGEGQGSIDLAGQSSGVYLLTVTAGGKTGTCRLVRN